MAKKNGLTVAKVQSLTHSSQTTKKKDKRTPDYHCDRDGLYLRVHPTGAKGWVYRYTLRDKKREMGLGSYPAFSLADARDAAGEQRKLVQKELDPIRQRDEEAAKQAAIEAKEANSRTFAECAKEYIEDKRDGWKNEKHTAQWVSTLQTYADPIIGGLPVHLITMSDVKRILQPIWKKKTETATRVRSRIEAVLGWAKAHGLREGDNPAAWDDNLINVLPAPTKLKSVQHYPSMGYAEIAEFIKRLRGPAPKAKGVHRISPQALEFTILTAARSGEVRGARFDEFDFDKRLWTVPASRMKMKKIHRVALSERAMAIVQAQPRKGALVFPGLHSNAMLDLLEHLKRDDVTVHGFRSTFRVWASEQTSYERDMLEFALAHKIRDAVEEAYNRTDKLEKRRKLMADWASFCDGVEVREEQIELPQDHPARVAYEKAMREMAQALARSNVVPIRRESKTDEAAASAIAVPVRGAA